MDEWTEGYQIGGNFVYDVPEMGYFLTDFGALVHWNKSGCIAYNHQKLKQLLAQVHINKSKNTNDKVWIKSLKTFFVKHLDTLYKPFKTNN